MTTTKTKNVKIMAKAAANLAGIVAAVCLMTLAAWCALPSPAAANADVKVTVDAGGNPGPFTARIGESEAEVKGTEHTFTAVPPGRYALTVEGAGTGGTPLIGIADVTSFPGRNVEVTVKIDEITDANGFCGGCHPEAGSPQAAQRKPRDLHPTGFDHDGEKADCLDCHTAHRPTGQRRFVVAPFAAANDLCASCHATGHARETGGFELCLSCHSLRTVEVEPGTSLISASSRTLPIMKSAAGKAPEAFGCTYCHSTGGKTEAMKDVLADFGAFTSRHPVGFTMKDGENTMNEYLSTAGSATKGELDCVDCHDPTLVVDQSAANLASAAPYANHAPPGSAEREGNPRMLRAKDRNTLCLGCHGEGAAFTKAVPGALSHGKGDLAEHDGTPLKTSRCADCHNAHSSAGALLFADGSESGVAFVMGDVADCTTVCHERGDSDNSFDTSGHGREFYAPNRPMGFDCGSCHSVDARHDGTGRDMLNFKVDERTSSFGSSLTSVCYICHSAYQAHPAKDAGAGCLDCHDEHGEGTGGGANIAMVPRRLPKGSASGVETVFEGAYNGRVDFYRKDGKGLCDNALCHDGATAGGTSLAPLKGLMKGGKHSGGDREPNSDCKECHSHRDPGGSWGAE